LALKGRMVIISSVPQLPVPQLPVPQLPVPQLPPHVGRKQTEEIIQKIMDRFPDTGKLSNRPSKPSQLISLNLNPPTDR
jgi:hypothetical protein